jgi:hypothetical protein
VQQPQRKEQRPQVQQPKQQQGGHEKEDRK